MTDITTRRSVLGKVKAGADSDKVPESTGHTVTLELDAFERQYHLVLVKVVPACQLRLLLRRTRSLAKFGLERSMTYPSITRQGFSP